MRYQPVALYALASLVINFEVEAAPLTNANKAWNINAETSYSPENYRGEWPSHIYFPSPSDWRTVPIFQVVTDRFADGDPTNNELFAAGYDVRDMTKRHGGDWRGLMQKLPYIQGLGCKGIWISPIFQNGLNSYHQYAQLDFTLLDQRLGTVEDFRALVTAAHELGMYILVDVVMNHMGNLFYFNGHLTDQAPFRFHEGLKEYDDGQREYLLKVRDPASCIPTPAGLQPYADFWYNNTWDPSASYATTVYGQYGENATDAEHLGTYDGSDFYHNGDLVDYFNIWNIHVGKIYGAMDDLRLSHSRVQAKYIAMTKSLISTLDVDGFRIDTPMQVPLNFFKVWAPAMRQHAKSLGKAHFGLFGEFYVSTQRYATMTGRGKNPHMYGRTAFLDGPHTMKGGIIYSSYWYTFTCLVHRKPEYADGFVMGYVKEQDILDTFEPVHNRLEYAMWTFCNNHDNWRMQSMTGRAEFLLCFALIIFFPGVALHYAGDEQNFNTPGTALDGWAREELATSLAWRGIRTEAYGNPADADNFDMTSPHYRYTARLYALRAAYFGDFSTDQCDDIKWPNPQIPNIVAFSRGCTADSQVLAMGNMNSTSALQVTMKSPWPSGTRLQDALAIDSPFEVTVNEAGNVSVFLGALQVMVFVAKPVKLVPPHVSFVSPSHAAAIIPAADGSVNGSTSLEIILRFDRSMMATATALAKVDGKSGLFRCRTNACLEIYAFRSIDDLTNGIHSVTVDEGAEAQDGMQTVSAFQAMFIVDRRSGSIAAPTVTARKGLICSNGEKLCHNAAGASFLRMKNVNDEWSAWRPYEVVSIWQAEYDVPVLVQYHAASSAAFIVTDCIARGGLTCPGSWHDKMYIRGEWNGWGYNGQGSMVKVDHYTWAANVTASGFMKFKFTPVQNWSISYGMMPASDLVYAIPFYDPRHEQFHIPEWTSGTEAVRKYMVSRGNWTEYESMASGAEFATGSWISHLCTPAAPPCPISTSNSWQCHSFENDQDMTWCATIGKNDPGSCYEYSLFQSTSEFEGCKPCSCCRRLMPTNLSADVAKTCCVLFNDLLLTYTITPDLSKCSLWQAKTVDPRLLIFDLGLTSTASRPHEVLSSVFFLSMVLLLRFWLE